MRTRFRVFRRTRPFWAALLVLAAGLIIGVLPLGPTDVLIHAGKGVFAGLVCAALLLVMGAVILILPSQRALAGIVAVLVSLASFPLSNLGGFVVGMLLGMLGGSMAFGWVVDRPPGRLARRVTRSGSPAPRPKPTPRPTPRPAPSPRGATV